MFSDLKKSTDLYFMGLKVASISAVILSIFSLFFYPSIAPIPMMSICFACFVLERKLRNDIVLIRAPVFTLYIFCLPLIFTAVFIAAFVYREHLQFPVITLFMIFFMPLIFSFHKILLRIIGIPLSLKPYGIDDNGSYHIVIDFMKKRFVGEYRDWNVSSDEHKIEGSSISIFDIRDNAKRYEEIIGKPISVFDRADFQLVEMYEYGN